MMNLLYRKSMPTLDLHGENKDSARVLIGEFISDNLKLEIYEVAIVHGIGEGILKKEVHRVLKKNRNVQEFGLDSFNEGCTLVKLSKTLDNKGVKKYNTRHNEKRGNIYVF